MNDHDDGLIGQRPFPSTMAESGSKSAAVRTCPVVELLNALSEQAALPDRVNGPMYHHRTLARSWDDPSGLEPSPPLGAAFANQRPEEGRATW